LQIDLRFASKDAGNLQVVVAPVLRFADIGFNADVRIDQLNNPDSIISGEQKPGGRFRTRWLMCSTGRALVRHQHSIRNFRSSEL